MKKSGFTIVELLVVIALIGVLISMSAYAAVKLGDERKKNLYDSKIKLALTQAKSYGQSILDDLNENCYCVTIGNLVNLGYLESEHETELILDPRTNTSIKDINICLRYENRKIVSSLKNESEVCN